MSYSHFLLITNLLSKFSSVRPIKCSPFRRILYFRLDLAHALAFNAESAHDLYAL